MNIYVSGTHTTKFGELWDKDFRELGIEAALGAIKSSGTDPKDIDAIYVANMCASRFLGQDHLGALFASELGLDSPAYHIEAACASGSMAIRNAYIDILSGNSKNVLVIGVEKMSDVSVASATSGLVGASDEEWEGFFGITFPSLYAMIAREHMRSYGTTREQMAMCSVKNHYHGSLNPNAQFQNLLTVEQVLQSAKVADPLCLLDCSPISDGAAAIVLSANKKSKIVLKSSGQAQSSLALHNRRDITSIDATQKAAERAFKNADIKKDQIGVLEVHDCFSIAEILAIEDLGFVNKGMGGNFVEDGNTRLDGILPTNTSGGLKASGHPVGATGIKQAVEVVNQLEGKCGKRQVQNEKKYGLTQNVGGSGATCVVNIFERLD